LKGASQAVKFCKAYISSGKSELLFVKLTCIDSTSRFAVPFISISVSQLNFADSKSETEIEIYCSFVIFSTMKFGHSAIIFESSLIMISFSSSVVSESQAFIV
jgi:hypothetical protein